MQHCEFLTTVQFLRIFYRFNCGDEETPNQTSNDFLLNAQDHVNHKLIPGLILEPIHRFDSGGSSIDYGCFCRPRNPTPNQIVTDGKIVQKMRSTRRKEKKKTSAPALEKRKKKKRGKTGAELTRKTSSRTSIWKPNIQKR